MDTTTENTLPKVVDSFGSKFEKFGGVLKSIDATTQMNLKVLEDIRDSNSSLVSIIEAQIRASGLQGVTGSGDVGGQPLTSDTKDSDGMKKAKEKSSIFGNILGGIFGGLGALAGTIFNPITGALSSAFSLIASPLSSIGRLFMRAGPIGAIIFGMYEVFKDIGENPIFTETMNSIQTTFNDRIVPTFNRIVESISSLIEPGTMLGDWFNNFRIQIQDFVLQTLDNITTTVAGVLEGIDLLLNGDWIGGIDTIARSLFNGVYTFFDNTLSNILETFGVDFGEGGSLFTSIGTSITNLTTSLSQKWDGFKTFISDSWDGFINFFVGDTGYVMTTMNAITASVLDKWNGFVNVLTVDVPNKIDEWRTAAFNSLDNMREVVSGFIGDVVDKFVWIKDVVVAFFDLKFSEVVLGLESAFASLSTRILNIPDQLYLAISENLRFGLPTISVPLPNWLGGGDFTILEGFDVGIGDASTQAAARANIEQRNTELADRLQEIDTQLEQRRERLGVLMDSTGQGSSNAVLNATAAAAAQAAAAAAAAAQSAAMAASRAGGVVNNTITTTHITTDPTRAIEPTTAV